MDHICAYGFAGVIDCGSAFRDRQHINPGQAVLYRTDKHGFFLTIEVVCAPNGGYIRLSNLLWCVLMYLLLSAFYRIFCGRSQQ